MPLLIRAAAWLVLPLALLLFAQWPLRDLLQAYSRQANDLAQVLFALYMAVAVSAAGSAGTHLAAAHAPDEHAGPPARWRAWALFACVAPWASFILWTSAAATWQSLTQMERFGETLNPGFFLVKCALWLLAALVLADAVRDLLRREPEAT